MDGRKFIHYFPNLVCGEAVSTFVILNKRFYKKRIKKYYGAKLIFWSFATFLGLTIFWLGAKERICFRESMSVLDQNGRIQALGFLARWRLTSHALYILQNSLTSCQLPFSSHPFWVGLLLHPPNSDDWKWENDKRCIHNKWLLKKSTL